MKNLILRNRYTLLITVLLVYTFALVVEGAITDREPDLLSFENSLFDFNLGDLVELSNLIEIDVL